MESNTAGSTFIRYVRIAVIATCGLGGTTLGEIRTNGTICYSDDAFESLN